MVMLMFTRFTNARSALNVNNLGIAGNILNTLQHKNISKSYCTTSKINTDPAFHKYGKLSQSRIVKPMKIYVQKSREFKEFIEKQIAEYNIGKRHLAKMMGQDPDNFEQKDIEQAIKYLFPSSLYDKEARPLMKHPKDLYITVNRPTFDEESRPHHFLYYTCNPYYYELLHNIGKKISELDEVQNKDFSDLESIYLNSITWLTKEELEKKLQEKIKLEDYKYFVTSMERLVEHPASAYANDFIMEYATLLNSIMDQTKIEEPQYGSDNRPFVVASCIKKTSTGEVKVIGDGTGNISINGKDITYFSEREYREQVSFKKNSLNNLYCRNSLCNL